MAAKRPVAFFVPSLRGGGAERAMLDLARGFASRGSRVDLVLAQAEGPYISQVPANIRIIDLQAERVSLSLVPLIKYLRVAQPDALLSTQMNANLVAIWAKRLARVSTHLVIREATTGSHPVYQTGSSVRFHISSRLAKLCYPWANGIVAVSEGVADDMAHHLCLNRNRIKVIYNAVYLGDIEELSLQPAAHPWMVSPNIPVVLSVGRLSREKDYSTLLQAFALVLKRRSARLVILGEGSERTSLLRLIQQLGIGEFVDMPGFVINPFCYMVRSAVFVLSSVCEGMPNALIQAASLGVPIISTDCPNGPREIIEKGGGGRLVPVGDETLLAMAIVEALETGGEKPIQENLLRLFSANTVLNAYGEILLKGETYV